MTDEMFALVWVLSFGLYLLIYTYWIPLRTQKKIETWLMSEESDETLLASLTVITNKIREQAPGRLRGVHDSSSEKERNRFLERCYGDAAQKLGETEEGSQLSCCIV